MPKSKRKRKKQKKNIAKITSRRKKPRWYDSIKGWFKPARFYYISFTILVGIVGLIAFMILLWPRVTILPPNPHDPSKNSPFKFTIVNEGNVSIANVQPIIGICYIVTFEIYENEKLDCSSSPKLRFIQDYKKRDLIKPDQRYYIMMEENLPGFKIHSADVSVILEFEVFYWPSAFKRRFRFEAEVLRDGKLHWLPEPSD